MKPLQCLHRELTLRRKLSNLATLNIDGRTILSNALLSTNTNDFPSALQVMILLYSSEFSTDISYETKDMIPYGK